MSIRPPMISMYAPDSLSRAAFIAALAMLHLLHALAC